MVEKLSVFCGALGKDFAYLKIETNTIICSPPWNDRSERRLIGRFF